MLGFFSILILGCQNATSSSSAPTIADVGTAVAAIVNWANGNTVSNDFSSTLPALAVTNNGSKGEEHHF
jgi:hypothetical protein